MQTRPLSLVLSLTLLAGCNLSELTRAREVIRTRVAGIAAEPAEIAPGESTTLSALLVHEPGVEPQLGALWFACVESSGATGCLGMDLDGFLDPGAGDDDDSAGGSGLGDFQFGVGEEFTYTAEGTLLDEAWAQLTPKERVEGITVLVSVNFVERTNTELNALLLRLGIAASSGDDAEVAALTTEVQELFDSAISAARRVVISDKSAGTPAAIDCPVAELAPNHNPVIEGLRLHTDPEARDASMPLGPITFARPGTELTLRPRLGDPGAEDYLYINRFDETECRTEAPWYAWMCNGGSLGRGSTFTADEGDLDEVEGLPKTNTFRLPEAGAFPDDGVDLWLVVRDRRGGIDWQRWRFLPLEGG